MRGRKSSSRILASFVVAVIGIALVVMALPSWFAVFCMGMALVLASYLIYTGQVF